MVNLSSLLVRLIHKIEEVTLAVQIENSIFKTVFLSYIPEDVQQVWPHEGLNQIRFVSLRGVNHGNRSNQMPVPLSQLFPLDRIRFREDLLSAYQILKTTIEYASW